MGKGRRARRGPMHLDMPEEFNTLITAREVRHCAIELQEDWKGLAAGTAVVLYPIEGKVVFRRMLGRGVISDFLVYLATRPTH